MDALVSQLTSATGLKNLSLIVPPLLWVNSILPHFYAVALTGGNFTNRAPREYSASISRKQTKTPTDEKFLRAEAASQNGFENLAWASAAIVAANLAKLPAKDINTLAVGYLLSRVLYNLSYIFSTTEVASYIRSVTFVGGVGILMKLFVSSAYALN
ncbi:unnamed protein product [Jaminaea pallidilutea]